MKRSMTISDRFDFLFQRWDDEVDSLEDYNHIAMCELGECLIVRECSVSEIRMAFSHWRIKNGRKEGFVDFSHFMPLIFNRLEKAVRQDGPSDLVE